jgi:hypothetical protein
VFRLASASRAKTHPIKLWLVISLLWTIPVVGALAFVLFSLTKAAVVGWRQGAPASRVGVPTRPRLAGPSTCRRGHGRGGVENKIDNRAYALGP